jgi:hypothetical protein
LLDKPASTLKFALWHKSHFQPEYVGDLVLWQPHLLTGTHTRRKKRLGIAAKSLIFSIFLVGGAGFEPATPTV